MRSTLASRVLILLWWCLGSYLQAQNLLPEVQERRLRNGVRILLVERPGVRAVHARLFLQGGQADTGALPAAAADLLVQCLFESPLEGEARGGKDLELLLKGEEGIFESIRLERIRLARHGTTQDSPEMQDLKAIHRQLLDQIRGLGREGLSRNAWGEAGMSQPEIRVEADHVSVGVDLPVGAFETYCRLASDRLKAPVLAKFPFVRDRLLEDMDTQTQRTRKALGVVLSTAFSGHPYGQVYDLPRASIEAIGWSSMRAYASSALAPEKAVLVLAGDLRLVEILPALERTFGALASGKETAGPRAALSIELPAGSGARRLQASIPGERRLLMSWRVPPATHPDHHALQVLVQMLGGGNSSRLVRRLDKGQGVAPEMSVRLGVPGGKDANLLLIEARPGDRQGLPDLEETIQGELIRLQRGAFEEGEIRRAQKQVEVNQVMIQEDAAELAEAIGSSVCQGGDWRLAFRAFQRKESFTQQEIQGIALKYLIPSQSVVALLEPDPLLLPQDHLESQTGKVLTKILEAKLDNPAQVESVVREALRQLRMLSIREREQTLKLLESQVNP